MNLSQLAINVRNTIGHEDKYEASTCETLVRFDFHNDRIHHTDLAKMADRIVGTDWSFSVRAIIESGKAALRITFTR